MRFSVTIPTMLFPFASFLVKHSIAVGFFAIGLIASGFIGDVTPLKAISMLVGIVVAIVTTFTNLYTIYIKYQSETVKDALRDVIREEDVREGLKEELLEITED